MGRAHEEKTLKGQGWQAERQPSQCPGVAEKRLATVLATSLTSDEASRWQTQGVL